MSLELISHRATKGYLGFSTKKVNTAQKKRQEILSNDLLNWFTPKHYPCIFLDRRLRTRFFR